MFDHKITTILDAFEDDLSETIKQSELPFLGHYPDVTYKTLKVLIVPKIRESKYPLQFFLQSLRKWPATFATYLDYYVADGYGSSGTIAVYPYIEKALHCSLSIQNKEDLWSGFRAACLCLGLSVSPRRSGSNYMVAEYLRQSGVPLNFLDELVSKMIKHADDVGLPDDNDPVAINHWRQGLLHQIRYLSKPVQKAIAADDDGYYVRLFVAAGAGQLQKCGKCSELEKRLIAALVSHAGDKKIRSKSMVIPKILFRDEQLGVELPQGESSQWRIEVDGKYEQYPGFLEARFIPLNAELPIKVDVVDLNGTAATSAELWEDQRNNRFLVFSENGAFVERGQLGQNEVIHLEPGEYDLLLRFEPTGFADELECLSDDPVLYVYRLSLDPAQTFELMRGPAKVKFRSDTKPALVWDGQKYRGIQGDELYASAGLSLDIKIPEELFFDETVKYILVLRYGTNEEPVEIPIKTDSGLARINIEEHCLGWLPGLARLLVELKREGFRRAESRSSIYLWNGLEQVTNRVLFQCSKLPACNNLLDSECDNVKVDPIGRIVTFKNPDQRLFRMVFQATEKHKQPFTWSVPGVFQQILKYHEHGMSEEPVKKGATLAITTRSRDVLEIFSTSNGSLQLGTFSKYVDFDRVGRTRIPLAGLVDYLRPGADTLLFCDCESQISDNLLRLVSPHHILDFNAELHGDKVILRFSTKDEMELISLNIRDMITGLKKELTISCNLTEVQGEEGFLLWLSSQHTSQNICEYELQFYLENWPDGAWIITFEGQIGKRWGRFSNTRNDHFAIGIPVVSNRIDRLARESWRYISVLSKEQQEIIFKRIHRRLLNCFSPQSWESVEWLGMLWSKLADVFSKEEILRKRVITLAEEQHDDSNSSSWAPLFTMISKFPLLYSQPIAIYRNLPNQRQLLSVKCFCVIATMKNGVLPLLMDGILNNLLAFGFSNAMEIAQGGLPKKFNLEQFSNTLKLEDISKRLRLLRQHEWQPGEGDYLGALHYRYAEEKLLRNFRASMTGNDYRRGKALSLCRNLHIFSLKNIPQNLVAGSGIIDLSQEIYDEETQSTLEEEHVHQIAKFLSNYARACRWEIRCSGTLNDTRARAVDHLGTEDDFDLVLGYLLCLGKDLFMYYLMLWETAIKTDFDDQEEIECQRIIR